MEEIRVFENKKLGSIRSVVIDGEPWFVGKDVAEILGYSNSSKALIDHVDEDDKLNNKSLSSLGQRGGWIINESGLYSLILSSKLPKAKEFKHWVTSEVLPSIRKHGLYATDTTIDNIINNPDFGIKLLEELKAEREKRLQAEMKNEINKPLVDFANHVHNSDSLISIGNFAKTLNDEGFDIGRNRLFKYMKNNNILMSNNVPYQKYIESGYFKVKEVCKSNSYGNKMLFSTTYITGKGQIWLYKKIMSK